MSTIRIDAETIAQYALILKNEVPDQYHRLTSCHQDLANMIEEGMWQGSTAENLAGEFYNMLIYRYAGSDRKMLDGFTGYLKKVTDNYALTEATNRNMARTFTD